MEQAPTNLLVMQLDHLRVALPLGVVDRVVQAVEPTPLPGAPPVVTGAINLAGRVLAVLELRPRFGLAARPVRPDDCFVIASGAGRLLALSVDQAEVMAIPSGDALLDPARLFPAVPGLLGVVRLPDGLLLVQEPDAFLSLDDAQALDQALPAEQGQHDD